MGLLDTPIVVWTMLGHQINFFSKPVRKKPHIIQKNRGTCWSHSCDKNNDEKEDDIIEDLNNNGTNIHDNNEETLSDRSEFESDLESENSAKDNETELETEEQYYVK